jgi:uncharacterized membrane protein YccC
MQLDRRNFLSLLIRSEPGKPAIANGVRAALCFGVPSIVGQLLDRREVGLFIGLIAYFVNLTNVDGSYSIKASAMMAATLGSAISMFVGLLIGSVPVLAVVMTFCWGLASGFAALYGNAGDKVGLVIGLSFLVAIARSGDIHLAMMQSLLCLFAGGWAMVLCLILWPFQPDRFLRLAVADGFKAIANYLQATSAKSATSKHILAIRAALERARSNLGTVRIGQSAPSLMDERLLVLIQDGDRLLGSTIALAELLENYAQSPQYRSVEPLITDALTHIPIVLQSIARVIAGKSTRIDLGQLDRLAALLKEREYQHPPSIQSIGLRNLVATIDKLIKQLQYTAASATSASERQQRGQRNIDLLLLVNNTHRSPWSLLRENLTLDSAIFRHALRLGISLTIGSILYRLTDLPMGYWVTLTIMLVLKPNLGATYQRFFQRVGGTLLGAAIAAILLATISSKPILDAIIILTVFFGVALIAVNYGSSVVFFSIFVLLVADLTDINDGMGWQFASLRILNTLIGAGLAFGTHYLLWPNWERDRLPSQLAAAVRTVAAYFSDVMAVYQGTKEYDSTIIGRRRQTGLAIGNAQASFQGLLREPNLSKEVVEPVMTLLVYVGRFTSAVTVLAEHVEHCRSSTPLPALATFERQISQVLTHLASAIEERTIPPPLPDLEATLASIESDLQAQTAPSPILTIDRSHRVDTPVRSDSIDYTILELESDQLVRRLTAMYEAIFRLKLASKLTR